MTVECFQVTMLERRSDEERVREYNFRFRTSKQLRKAIKTLLTTTTLTSLSVTIAREERDPVENTAS